MARNFKALGLALAAVFAMSAVAASAASAHTFHISTSPATPTASALNTQQFKIEGAAEESNCTGISATGELLNGKEEETVAPSYTGCTATRNGTTVPATVETTGCWYRFTGATDAEGHAQVHIECPTGIAGIHIKITSLKLQCFTIPPQTVTGVHYVNNGTAPNRDIKIQSTVKHIKTEKSGACGEGTVEAEYNGEVTVKAHDSKENPVEVWFE